MKPGESFRQNSGTFVKSETDIAVAIAGHDLAMASSTAMSKSHIGSAFAMKTRFGR
jgi:hypothetical protein